jgi:hypothetical protein
MMKNVRMIITVVASIATKTLKPQLAASPMPMATDVIISFSMGKDLFFKDKPYSQISCLSFGF